MATRDWLETLLFRLVILIWDLIHPRQALTVGGVKRTLRADAKALKRQLRDEPGLRGALERAQLGWQAARKDPKGRATNLYFMKKRLGRPLSAEEEALQLESIDQLRGSMGHILHLQRQVPGASAEPSSLALAEAVEGTIDLLVNRSVSTVDLATVFQPVSCARLDLLVCRPGVDAFFTRLTEDLHAATSHINVAMYGIRDEDGSPTSTARGIAELLAQRAAEGMQVNFIYDAFGTGVVGPRQNDGCRELIEWMSGNGIFCMPNDPWDLQDTETLLRLDHRKLFVIDGKIGYVGGMGIEDHFDNRRPGEKCHDVMARFEGEIVQQFQCAFLNSLAYQLTRHGAWDQFAASQTADSLRQRYFPAGGDGGDAIEAVCLMNVPVAGVEQISREYLRLAGEAEQHVYFMNPHSSEDRIAKVLRKTAKRLEATGKTWGAEGPAQGVLGLFPGGESEGLGQKTQRHEFPGLMKAGMKILLYREGWLHGKVAAQDLDTAIVGSCNLDYFSMTRNWEIAICVRDRGVAEAVVATIFARDEPPNSVPAREKYSIWERIIFWLSDQVDRYF